LELSLKRGNFYIRNVLKGIYTIISAYVGLQKQQKRINIIKSEVLTINFTLQESSQKLNEIVVTARRTANKVPVSVGKIIYYAFRTAKLKSDNVGLTAAYVGNMLAGCNTTRSLTNTNKITDLPSFNTLDLSAGYLINKLSFRAKVFKLTNTLAYYAHDDNSINPIAPRQFVTTLAYKLNLIVVLSTSLFPKPG